MLREISESEYKKIANANPNALDYRKLREKENIIDECYSWILIKNEYPYKEFLNKEVKEHYLIVNKRDGEENIWEFEEIDNQFLMIFLKRLGIEYPKSAIMYKNKDDKSVRKFHIHLIIF